MTRRARAGLALAAGATLSLGAPPLGLWPAALVAIALLGLAVDGASAPRAFLSGWIAGTAATLGAFYWIVGTVTRFTDLPLAAAVAAYVLMAALAGLTHGLACGLAAAAAPVTGYPVALGLGVVIAERYAPSVFPWQLAAPLVFAPWISQAADLVGVSGLGALLAGALLVIARWVRARVANARRRGHGTETTARPWRPALALALLAALWVYGGVRTAQVRAAMEAAPRTRVALVQPAIPPTVRWEADARGGILLGLHAQTAEAIAGGAQLVVWSEGAFPYPLPHRAGTDGEVAPPIYPAAAPVPILVGAVTLDERAERRYNAALLREPDGSLSAPAAKQVLVPFGEYVPVVGRIEWVRRRFARAGGLTPGAQPAVLRTVLGSSTPGAPRAAALGVLNCFEDTLPYAGAALASTDVLVNVTNDAWFGDGAAPWQHLMLARWRAIETRREMVRAVNTGVSCHVDALGGVERAAPVGRPAVLAVEPRRMALRPLAPGVIVAAPPLAAIVVAAALLARLRRRTARRAATPGGAA